MPNPPSSPTPKPIADVWRPELVALPTLTPARRIIRLLLRGLTKLLTALVLRAEVTGLENFPRRGPALIVFNHLGDADAVLILATLPFASPVEGIGKVELSDHWLVGPVFRLYGIIWIHRGQPDRKALRAALEALAEGRMVVLAPEGKQSETGGLEEGSAGAAFLALKSGAPLVPVALTGTENSNVYGNLKRWKRTAVTLSVGESFFIRAGSDTSSHPAGRAGTAAVGTKDRIGVRQGTVQIMQALARLLPESYRGIYRSIPKK